MGHLKVKVGPERSNISCGDIFFRNQNNNWKVVKMNKKEICITNYFLVNLRYTWVGGPLGVDWCAFYPPVLLYCLKHQGRSYELSCLEWFRNSFKSQAGPKHALMGGPGDQMLRGFKTIWKQRNINKTLVTKYIIWICFNFKMEDLSLATVENSERRDLITPGQ